MDTGLPTVLYVDDESLSLKYFTLQLQDEFNILTATSAKEGQSIVRKHATLISVIVTDERMPQEQGSDWLAKLRKSHPRIVRLLTSAYFNQDQAEKMYENGLIHGYIFKPWSHNELRFKVHEAVKVFRILEQGDARMTTRFLRPKSWPVPDRRLPQLVSSR